MCEEALKYLSDVAFIMLINVKMPTIVGILTFMSRINSCSAELSMKRKFYNLGAGFPRVEAYFIAVLTK